MEVRHLRYLLIVVIGVSSLTSAALSSPCSRLCERKKMSATQCGRICGKPTIGKRQPTLSENFRWMDDREELASEVPKSIQPSLLEQHFNQLRPELQRIVYQVILDLEISQMEG